MAKLDIGDITFGLQVNTRGLDAASQRIKSFGRTVERAFSDEPTSTPSIRLRQERGLVSGFQRTNRLIGETIPDSQEYNDLTRAFHEYSVALMGMSRNTLDVDRAQRRFDATLKQVATSLKEYDQKLTLVDKGVKEFDKLKRSLRAAGASRTEIAELTKALERFEDVAGGTSSTVQESKKAYTEFSQTLAMAKQRVTVLTRAQRDLGKAGREAESLRERLRGIGASSSKIGAVTKAFNALQKVVKDSSTDAQAYNVALAKFNNTIQSSKASVAAIERQQKALREAARSAARLRTRLEALQEINLRLHVSPWPMKHFVRH